MAKGSTADLETIEGAEEVWTTWFQGSKGGKIVVITDVVII